MTVALELVLVNGQRRRLTVPGPTGTVANALGRLDSWVATDDGGWVQKSSIVEVRPYAESPTGGSDVEYQQLSDAASRLAGRAEN
jgi:hypothetical protein